MNFYQLKKVIESCHLNFLIGSGASKPFFGTLGFIEKLLTDLSNEVIDHDILTIIDASIKKHYYNVAIKGNLSLCEKGNSDLDLTYKNYNDFLGSINVILSKRKSNLISKQANLFTPNMDLFLDKTIEANNFAINDGFSGRLDPIFGTENFHNTIRKTSTHYEYQSEVPLFNLFKIHGSVNWKLENEKIITFDYGLSILNDIEKIELKNEDFLDITYSVTENEIEVQKYFTIKELIKQCKDKKLKIKGIHNNFLNAYNKLVMINPTKEKFETTTRNLTFYELLRMYSNLLEKENSVLFVFGFSFADEHLREITKRVSASNPTLLVIIFAYDLEAKTAIENEIPERNNVIIISDPKNEIKYSFDVINKEFFQKLSYQLSNPVKK